VIILPSHDGNGTTEVTWPRCNVDAESCWQQCCRVMLATMMSSHAFDGAVEATWPRRDVEAK
jgi:hypothetical protein